MLKGSPVGKRWMEVGGEGRGGEIGRVLAVVKEEEQEEVRSFVRRLSTLLPPLLLRALPGREFSVARCVVVRTHSPLLACVELLYCRMTGYLASYQSGATIHFSFTLTKYPSPV